MTCDDAPLIAEILGQKGFEVCVLDDVGGFDRAWHEGAGVSLIASEALNDEDCCTNLRRLLDDQEIFLMIRQANHWSRKPAAEVTPSMRDCPQCLSPVPQEALRCRFCTQTIAAVPESSA